MDRFDCQYLMATFVNVYISSFIHTASPQKLLQQVRKEYLIYILCIIFISCLRMLYNKDKYNLLTQITFMISLI